MTNFSSSLPALDFAHAKRQPWLDSLLELLRFPTISSQFPANQADFEACTNWLVQTLGEMGLQHAQKIATGGPEVVYADWLEAGATPTLLVYGHYDVMPVDPLSDWLHTPFEPFVDEKRIYARGASDDKGQFFALLCAAEAWIKTGGLPVNLKVLLEGEEEETSRHLVEFIQQKRDLLSCDGIVIADMDALDPLVPLVEYGTRGNCSMEVTVRGPAHDLHSGTYGGAVDNPLNVLVRILAQIQDGRTRKILVPGFYDRVKELTSREQALSDEVPITDEAGQALTGVPALGGEAGYPLKTSHQRPPYLRNPRHPRWLHRRRDQNRHPCCCHRQAQLSSGAQPSLCCDLSSRGSLPGAPDPTNRACDLQADRQRRARHRRPGCAGRPGSQPGFFARFWRSAQVRARRRLAANLEHTARESKSGSAGNRFWPARGWRARAKREPGAEPVLPGH